MILKHLQSNEIEAVELIGKLLRYTRSLEDQIIDLRIKVNRLSPKDKPIPYFDLHSDIYKSFDDHPIYERYKEYLESFL